MADGATGEETRVNPVHADRMATDRPVIVHPPGESGGRRVRVDGTILGLAYSPRDIAAFMQEAGLAGFDEMDVVRSGLIEWRGGGPNVWEA